ncbi:MAG TPA: DUF2142 domain-containing protein [Candidatus Saccharimonadales bacterium]|nr:DUF2142 domain-containing protein [Candidatus Saccharimonadales bacterium]
MQRLAYALKTLWSVLRNPIARLEWFVAGGVLLFGLLFIAAIPPMQGGDESNHFLRAYQISQGNIIADRVGESRGGIATFMQYFDHNVGGQIPKGVADFTYDAFDDLPQHYTYKMNAEDFKRLTQYKDGGSETTGSAFGNTAAWSPVAYIPQLLAIWLGQLFNAPPLALMYMARLAGLLFATVMVFFIIRLMPFGKLIMAVLILMPMTISQFAIVSADATSYVFAFMIVALTLHMAFRDKPLSRKDLILLGATFIIMGCVKLSFLPLTLVAFALLANKHIARKQAWLISGGLIGLTLIFGLAWNLLVKDLVVEGFHMSYPHNDYQAQLSYILHEPWNFVRVLLNTFLTSNFNYVPTSFVGYFGWSDTPMPLLGVCAGVALLSLAVFVTAQHDTATIPKWLHWIGWVAIAGIVIGSSTYMYLFCNAPRDPFIVGSQGRYIIPAVPLLPLVFIGTKKLIRNDKYAVYARRCLYTSVILLVAMTFITFSRFYNVPAIL